EPNGRWKAAGPQFPCDPRHPTNYRCAAGHLNAYGDHIWGIRFGWPASLLCRVPLHKQGTLPKSPRAHVYCLKYAPYGEEVFSGSNSCCYPVAYTIKIITMKAWHARSARRDVTSLPHRYLIA